MDETDDARVSEPDDPYFSLVADIDQYVATIRGGVGKCLAADWQALVDAGVPPVAAAVIVGTRWKITS